MIKNERQRSWNRNGAGSNDCHFKRQVRSGPRFLRTSRELRMRPERDDLSEHSAHRFEIDVLEAFHLRRLLKVLRHNFSASFRHAGEQIGRLYRV